MKSIINFITEKLKINKNIKLSPLSRQTMNNWIIDDAKPGDIICYQDSDLYFVYVLSLLSSFDFLPLL